MDSNQLPDLTPRQGDVLDWLKRQLATNDRAPSTREIAGAFGFSRARVTEILKELQTRRRIVIHPGKHRGIEVLPGR